MPLIEIHKKRRKLDIYQNTMVSSTNNNKVTRKTSETNAQRVHLLTTRQIITPPDGSWLHYNIFYIICIPTLSNSFHSLVNVSLYNCQIILNLCYHFPFITLSEIMLVTDRPKDRQTNARKNIILPFNIGNNTDIMIYSAFCMLIIIGGCGQVPNVKTNTTAKPKEDQSSNKIETSRKETLWCSI